MFSAQAAAIPPATPTTARTTTIGMAILCQRDLGGLRRLLRMRVAIETIVISASCGPGRLDGAATLLAELRAQLVALREEAQVEEEEGRGRTGQGQQRERDADFGVADEAVADQ